MLLFISSLILIIRKKNKQLKVASSFKDKVQSILSHDLRSPLTGLTQLYEQYNYWTKKNEPQQLEKISHRIDEAAANMATLLNNILLCTTNIKFNQKTKININNSINNVTNVYQHLMQAKNIAVINNVKLSDTLTGNNNVLELIIRNWVDNIVKHAKPTQIIFEATISNGTTTLYIKDNGTMCNDTFINIQALLSNQNKNIINSFGLGLLFINEFATKENWVISLSKQQNETVFCITFA